MSRADVLIDAPALAEGLDAIDLLDVRWTLGEADGAGHQRYLAGHLPGARFLDFEAVLTSHGAPIEGRHPLPDAATLADGMAAIGVNGERPIVVYDEAGSFAAGRAWWVLRWAGLKVRVLDGGIAAWQAAGLPLDTGPGIPATQQDIEGSTGTPRLRLGSLPTITADQTASFAARGALIDARAAERFRGEVEPIDPVAGHIPGAVNRPVAGFFAADGRLPDAATLDERLAGLPEGLAVYCGSGVSAAQIILALASRGITAALYPGSWSAWSNDPSRPVETGRSESDAL